MHGTDGLRETYEHENSMETMINALQAKGKSQKIIDQPQRYRQF